MKQQQTLLVLAVAAALGGCFGGGSDGGSGGNSNSGGSGSSNSNSASTSLSGKVVDGYIEGAEVCLDVDADKVCDTSKVSTAADGSYTLAHSLNAAQLATAHVLVNVPDTAKDADDKGKTLKDAGKKAFELLAPASQPQLVSPLTTLVSAEMISNQSTVAQAEQGVRSALGLGSDKPLLGQKADFVAGKDQSLQQLAQVATVLQGEVAKTVNDTTTSAGIKTSIMQQQLVSLQATRQMLNTLQGKLDLSTLASSGKIDVSKVQGLLTTTLKSEADKLKNPVYVKQQAASLVAPSATANASQLLSKALYSIEFHGDNSAELCWTHISDKEGFSRCYYSKKSDDNWSVWEASSGEILLGSKGWHRGNWFDRYQLNSDAQSLTLFDDDDHTAPASTRLVFKGAQSPQNWFPAVSFNSDDQAYPISVTPLSGPSQYELYQPVSVLKNGEAVYPTSFDELKTALAIATKNWFGRGVEHSSLGISFDGEKLVFSKVNAENGHNVLGDKVAGSGSFQLTTIGGHQVMLITVPDALRGPLGLEPGHDFIFASYDNKVYQGQRKPQFAGNGVWLNASAANQVLVAKGLPSLSTLPVPSK